MTYLSKIKKLTQKLFPTGRAFKMPVGGYFDLLTDALTESEARAYADALSTLDSALPDNNNFTESDATSWETRLGLPTNISIPLADRKLAIMRKMNHPGTVKARENYRFMESQLQAAGFDVYVYENRFDDGLGGWETMSPTDFSSEAYPSADVQLGDAQLGTFSLEAHQATRL